MMATAGTQMAHVVSRMSALRSVADCSAKLAFIRVQEKPESFHRKKNICEGDAQSGL